MSTFGSSYKTSTFGESHCKSVGVIIDGVPPGLAISESDIQTQLSRRRPGQSELTTPRNEADAVTILSGVEMGYSLGTPIAMLVNNKDHKPKDYGEMDFFPRPSHADYTYLLKYGIKASSGGGRSSARETIGRVCSGAVAELYLSKLGIEIIAFVSSVGNVSMNPTSSIDYELSPPEEYKPKWDKWWSALKTITRAKVDETQVRCPDEETADRMRKRIIKAKEDDNSIGGVVTCVIRNCPTGLGEPAFDKFEAVLAHAMLSIPATKGFEFGSGFDGTKIPGSIHNDPFVKKEDGSLGTTSNFSGIREMIILGGVQGGITNGQDIYFNVAFKSVATIGKAQPSAQYDGSSGTLEAKGRHDPCVLPRAVPIVESMAAIVVMDLLMIQNGRSATKIIDATVPAVLKGELGKGNIA